MKVKVTMLVSMFGAKAGDEREIDFGEADSHRRRKCEEWEKAGVFKRITKTKETK